MCKKKRDISQSAESVRWPVASVLLVLTRGRDLSRSANAVSAENCKFFPPLSFSALVQGDPFRIYRKASRILKLVFQAADSETLVILTCTAFD